MVQFASKNIQSSCKFYSMQVNSCNQQLDLSKYGLCNKFAGQGAKRLPKEFTTEECKNTSLSSF